MVPIPPQNNWLSNVKIEEWDVPKDAHFILGIDILVGVFNILD